MQISGFESKAHGLLLPRSGMYIGLKCNHVERHPLLLGLDSHSLFRTTTAAKYPVSFCPVLSQRFMQRLSLAQSKHFTMPQHAKQLGHETRSDRGSRGPMLAGSGLNRVQDFLLHSLKPSTVQKYTAALKDLSNELVSQGHAWSTMSEEEQDNFIAEWLLDGYEAGAGRSEYGWALSALHKIYPRLRLKTAWRVYNIWGQYQPARQAPAATPEFLHGMIAMACSGETTSGLCHGILLCWFASGPGVTVPKIS